MPYTANYDPRSSHGMFVCITCKRVGGPGILAYQHLIVAMSSPCQGPGHRAFCTHLDTLRAAITEPGCLATQLYAKGLLTSLAHQKANQASLAPLERSYELLNELDGRIASDDGAFDKFLTVLNEDPVMEELCGRLRESEGEGGTGVRGSY